MTQPKLTKLELGIMEALWEKGASCIREIQECFPEESRPAYTHSANHRLSARSQKGSAPGQKN
jgi:hypothetical protein